MLEAKARRPHARLLSLLYALLALVVSLAIPVHMAQAEEHTVSLVIEGQASEAVSGDAGDNASLLDAYVERRFDEEIPSDVLLSAQAAPTHLSGNDAVLYELLRPMVEEVAAGKRESTEFELDVDAVFGQSSFTAEDLSVESIFEGDAVSQDAMSAFGERIKYDLNNVLDALVNNCPYDLYWFDKTVLGCCSADTDGISTYVSGNYVGDEYVGCFILEGKLVIRMVVASDYAIDTYTVDTSTGERVERAVKQAKVVAYENEGLDAYTRLVGFKDAICAYVTYDYDSAEGGVAYGDPWQLVSVFDGDDSTNVVCEGYAKAFKYLCDLADMDGIECRLPTGVMGGGTGAGNHMWNIVQMDDGLNYLVDVTNCDEGSIGADDLLFLVPYATGSVDEGYVFEPGGESITYAYGEETTRYFDTDELTLTDTPYNTGAAHKPTEGWTAFGGCEWCVVGDTMTIRPLQNRATGTLANTYGYPMPGVNEPSVRHIIFADGVRAAHNMVSLFDGATNIETIDFGDFDTSKCTDMTGMFGSCSSLTELDLSGFDTSNVEYMADMFGGCSNLTHVDLSSFDTHLVNDLSTMFRYCSSLTELDLSHFDTTNVANFYDMFWDCTSLVTLDISGFDPTHGHAWSNMFHNCPSLSELTVGESWAYLVDTMMPEPTNERGWYSNADKKWYSKEEIVSSRSRIADTYASWAPKVKLENAKVELAEGPYVYDGRPIAPIVSVSVGDSELSEGTDYVVSYEKNVDAGEASYVVEGAGDYEGSSKGSFQIEARELVIKTPSATKTYDGSALVSGEVVVEGQAEGDVPAVMATGAQTLVGSSKNGYLIDWADVNPANYVVTEEVGTLTVEPRKVTLTSKSAEKEFDRTELVAHVVDVTGDGFAPGESAEYTFTGTQTKVGSSENAFAYTLSDTTLASNYDIVVVYGTLTVTQGDPRYEIEVEAVSDSLTYDGTWHTLSGLVQDSFEFDGEAYVVKGLYASVTACDAGTHTLTVKGVAAVYDEDGEEVTWLFSIATLDGQLTINPAKLDVSTKSDSKTYDGEPLANAEVKVEGLKGDDAPNITATGSQTDVGSSVNGCQIDWGDVRASNYRVEEKLGMLTVVARPVVVRANDASKVVGAPDPELTASVTGLVGEDAVEYTLAREAGDAEGTYTILVTGEEEQGNYRVAFENGTFSITTYAASTISLAAQSKVYTGEALAYSGTVTKTGSTGDVAFEYYSDAACTKSVAAQNVRNAGTYYVRATLASDDSYAGATSDPVTFTITKSAQTITASNRSVVFGGSVSLGAKSSGGGKLTFRSTNASVVTVSSFGVLTGGSKGAAQVTITAAETDNYNATTRTVSVTVTAADISKATVSGVTNRTYSGKAQTQAPTVKVGSMTLKSGTDYALSYKNNVNAGTATVTVTGKGNYTGTKAVTFKIKPASISGATVASVAEQGYTGSAIKPTPAVKLGSVTLKRDTDYALSYKANKAVGIATVTVTGKGNYAGTKSATFKIVDWVGASRIPVKATAKYTLLKGGYMRVRSGGKYAKSDAYVSISGVTITGRKAGKTTVYLFDSKGRQVAKKTIEVFTAHNKTYEFESSVDRNYVLDIQGGSKKDGAQMIVYRRNNGKNQRYTLYLQSDGTYAIKSVNSGRYLTVEPKTNKYVQQWAWKGTKAQRWRLTVDSSNRATFVNVATSKCFDVQGGKTKNSAKMIVWQSNNGLNQKWKLNQK